MKSELKIQKDIWDYFSVLFRKFRMRDSDHSDRSGQTLVEILISLGLFSGLSLAIITLFLFSAQAVQISNERLSKRGDLRKSLEYATGYVREHFDESSANQGVYRLNAENNLELVSGAVSPPCIVIANVYRASADPTARLTKNTANPCVAPAVLPAPNTRDFSGKAITAYDTAGDVSVSLTRFVSGWAGLVFEQTRWDGSGNQEFWLDKRSYLDQNGLTLDPQNNIRLIGGTDFREGPKAECLIDNQDSNVATKETDNVSIAVDKNRRIFTSWMLHVGTKQEQWAARFDRDFCNGAGLMMELENESKKGVKGRINYSGTPDRTHRTSIRSESFASKTDSSVIVPMIAELENNKAGSCLTEQDPVTSSLFSPRFAIGPNPNPIPPVKPPSAPGLVCPWAIWYSGNNSGGHFPKFPKYRPDLIVDKDEHSQHGTSGIVLNYGFDKQGNNYVAQPDEKMAVIGVRQNIGTYLYAFNKDGESFFAPREFIQSLVGVLEPPRMVPIPFNKDGRFAMVLIVQKQAGETNLVIPIYKMSIGNDSQPDINLDKCYVEKFPQSQLDSLSGFSIAVAGKSDSDLKFVVARSNEADVVFESRITVHEAEYTKDFKEDPGGDLACLNVTPTQDPRGKIVAIPSQTRSADVLSNVRVEFIDNNNYTVAFGRLAGASKAGNFEMRYVTNRFDAGLPNRCFADPACETIATVEGLQFMDMDTDGQRGLYFIYTRPDTLGPGVPGDIIGDGATITPVDRVINLVSSSFDLGKSNARIEGAGLMGSSTGPGGRVRFRACASNNSNRSGSACSSYNTFNTQDGSYNHNSLLRGPTIPLRGRYVWYEIDLTSPDGTVITVDSISTKYGF